MGNLLRLITGNSSVQSTASVDLDHLDLVNDLSVPVELDLGQGWQVLEPWQTRRMAKEAFQIRLRDDQSVGCGISKEHVENLHERVVQTSKHLDSFSEIIRAEAKKVWSEMYLKDDPKGNLHFINDLQATVEVDHGRGWRMVYPKEERVIRGGEFTIRLQEAPQVTSTCHRQQLDGQSAVSVPVTFRTAEALGDFSLQAIDWTKRQDRKIEKEAKDQEQRKKVFDQKAVEAVRKEARVFWFVIFGGLALLLVLGLFVFDRLEVILFPVTFIIAFFSSPKIRPSNTVRSALIFFAFFLLSLLVVLALAISASILEPSGAFAVLGIGLAFSLLGLSCGILAHWFAPGGFIRKEIQERRLKEENILFEGTVSEESLG